jgi:hypothetical protein
MLTYAAVYAETRLTIAAAAVKAKDAALMDAETRIAALGAYAHVCSRMLTYARVCRVRTLTWTLRPALLRWVRTLTYAHVCSRMLGAYADVC